MSEGLVVWQGHCLPEWLDYNGHMSEAYYVLAFGYATDGLMAHIGLDAAYRQAAAASLYTVESHIRYLDEVSGGTALTVQLQLLEFDAKRVRYYLRLLAEGKAAPVATSELLGLHVAGRPPRSSAFPEKMRLALEALKAGQAELPWPDDAGRGIALKR